MARGNVLPLTTKDYSASGALDTSYSIHEIAVDGVGAMTLADPPADYDGHEMTIVASTANAHTVTYTGGFGEVGTGGDVATFGGAKGDSMTIVAKNSIWYVKSLYNVTLG